MQTSSCWPKHSRGEARQQGGIREGAGIYFLSPAVPSWANGLTSVGPFSLLWSRVTVPPSQDRCRIQEAKDWYRAWTAVRLKQVFFPIVSCSLWGVIPTILHKEELPNLDTSGAGCCQVRIISSYASCTLCPQLLVPGEMCKISSSAYTAGSWARVWKKSINSKCRRSSSQRESFQISWEFGFSLV